MSDAENTQIAETCYHLLEALFCAFPQESDGTLLSKMVNVSIGIYLANCFEVGGDLEKTRALLLEKLEGRINDVIKGLKENCDEIDS